MILGFPGAAAMRGDYLAIVTLAFWREIIRHQSSSTGSRFFRRLCSASNRDPARITALRHTVLTDDDGFADESLHHALTRRSHRKIFLAYLILALALLTNFITTLRLRRLPIGRAWEALREDEIACRSLGINTRNTKLTAFALGAFFGGLAGSFFAVRQGFVSPESFTFSESATILAIVVLGGMGSQIGVALSATVLVGGFELLRQLDWLKTLVHDYLGVADFDPIQYRGLLFGLAMVLMMIFRPRGFVSTRMPSIYP